MYRPNGNPPPEDSSCDFYTDNPVKPVTNNKVIIAPKIYRCPNKATVSLDNLSKFAIPDEIFICDSCLAKIKDQIINP